MAGGLSGTPTAATPQLRAVTTGAIFFDCGVSGGADVIPQQETDLIVAAELIVDDVDNLIDTRTSPDSYFGTDGILCTKLNICMCGPDCV
jgi:hypothetical protein